MELRIDRYSVSSSGGDGPYAGQVDFEKDDQGECHGLALENLKKYADQVGQEGRSFDLLRSVNSVERRPIEWQQEYIYQLGLVVHKLMRNSVK